MSAFRAVACRRRLRPAPRRRSRHHGPSQAPRAASARTRGPARAARAATARHPAPPAHAPAQAHLPRIAWSRQLTLKLGARLLLGTVGTVDRVLGAHLRLLGAPLRVRALALDAACRPPTLGTLLVGPSSTSTGRGPRREPTRLLTIEAAGMGWSMEALAALSRTCQADAQEARSTDRRWRRLVRRGFWGRQVWNWSPRFRPHLATPH